MVKRFVREHGLKVTKNKMGYVLAKDGYLEHRLIYEANYGKIPKGYLIHHVDGKKDNNKPSNLMAIPPIVHNRLHTHMIEVGLLTRAEQERFCKPLVEKFQTDVIQLKLARSRLITLLAEVAKLEEAVGLSGKIRSIDRRAVTKLLKHQK